MLKRMPVVSRIWTVTVRTGRSLGPRPTSTTPGLFGMTSKLFAFTIGGTGSTPGSLEVIEYGLRPPDNAIGEGKPESNAPLPGWAEAGPPWFGVKDGPPVPQPA